MGDQKVLDVFNIFGGFLGDFWRFFKSLGKLWVGKKAGFEEFLLVFELLTCTTSLH